MNDTDEEIDTAEIGEEEWIEQLDRNTQQAVEWNSSLSTKYKTCTAVGRPEKMGRLYQ